MKQRFKFLSLAVGLPAGMTTMTSCLNSDSEPLEGRYGVISKVYSGYFTYFKTPGQDPVTISPTESSINELENLNSGFLISSLAGQVVAIDFTWNTDLLQFPADAKEYDGVDLGSIYPLNAPTLVVSQGSVGGERDSVATHAVISANPQIGGYKYQPYFFDDTRREIVVPVNYYYPLNTGATAASVTLVYYPDDPQTAADRANGTLRLYLNYRVRGVEDFSTQYKSSDLANYYYGGLTLFYKAYSLNNFISAWGGAEPQKVVVVAHENEYSTSLDDPQTKAVEYPVLTFEEYEASFINN